LPWKPHLFEKKTQNLNFLFWRPLDLLRRNFTETITAIDRSVSNVWKIQNGCRCHGNHKHVHNSLILFFSEMVDPFTVKLYKNHNLHE
jgi:hypothetical protein